MSQVLRKKGPSMQILQGGMCPLATPLKAVGHLVNGGPFGLESPGQHGPAGAGSSTFRLSPQDSQPHRVREEHPLSQVLRKKSPSMQIHRAECPLATPLKAVGHLVRPSRVPLAQVPRTASLTGSGSLSAQIPQEEKPSMQIHRAECLLTPPLKTDRRRVRLLRRTAPSARIPGEQGQFRQA